MSTMLSGAAALARSEAREDASLVIAGTVHDLGNLIQVASSAVNIVARGADLPATQRKPMLDRARESLDQAAALAQNAIRLIRGDAARIEYADVASCIREVAGKFEEDDPSRLTLRIEVEPDLPSIACSELGLQCALINLLFNARDASAGKGVVTVRAMGALEDGLGKVELSVADEGIGMSAATIEQALDPFFTTKTDGTGGIGLPMVDRFVREAGGTLQIDSKLGLGTTVTMHLPTCGENNLGSLFVSVRQA
jgi:signal transduction histidine kinase